MLLVKDSVLEAMDPIVEAPSSSSGSCEKMDSSVSCNLSDRRRNLTYRLISPMRCRKNTSGGRCLGTEQGRMCRRGCWRRCLGALRTLGALGTLRVAGTHDCNFEVEIDETGPRILNTMDRWKLKQ